MVEHAIAIQTSGISRVFKKLRAVNSVNLTIQQGELFSLLGPNGAGKTTTIKMLCCLLKPSSGTATIMGHDIQKDPLAVKQIIDVSPQETALSENLNAWENLNLTGRSHGLEKSVVRQRSQELLEMMGLMDRSKERVKRFSGGMKRRLSIAMALVSDPQVLFLDEPTLGLDPQSRAAMWEHINQIKGSKTVMLTTHYLEEADSLADRIAIMDEGRIVVLGTSQELKDGISEQSVLRVEAEGLTNDVVERLREIYPEVTVVDGGVEIRAEKLDLYEILDFLRPRGIVVRSTQLKQASLDDVFLHHTGRELRE
ncbi:ATP-binding cassette domain-containing protein [Candidatus Bipolaricaulota bacterium]|nr:ATP-binding cassette domain-containing protein [Candidatus Bipolaricaulota bacterium]